MKNLFYFHEYESTPIIYEPMVFDNGSQSQKIMKQYIIMALRSPDIISRINAIFKSVGNLEGLSAVFRYILINKNKTNIPNNITGLYRYITALVLESWCDYGMIDACLIEDISKQSEVHNKVVYTFSPMCIMSELDTVSFNSIYCDNPIYPKINVNLSCRYSKKRIDNDVKSIVTTPPKYFLGLANIDTINEVLINFIGDGPLEYLNIDSPPTITQSVVDFEYLRLCNLIDVYMQGKLNDLKDSIKF